MKNLINQSVCKKWAFYFITCFLFNEQQGQAIPINNEKAIKLLEQASNKIIKTTTSFSNPELDKNITLYTETLAMINEAIFYLNANIQNLVTQKEQAKLQQMQQMQRKIEEQFAQLKQHESSIGTASKQTADEETFSAEEKEIEKQLAITNKLIILLGKASVPMKRVLGSIDKQLKILAGKNKTFQKPTPEEIKQQSIKDIKMIQTALEKSLLLTCGNMLFYSDHINGAIKTIQDMMSESNNAVGIDPFSGWGFNYFSSSSEEQLNETQNTVRCFSFENGQKIVFFHTARIFAELRSFSLELDKRKTVVRISIKNLSYEKDKNTQTYIENIVTNNIDKTSNMIKSSEQKNRFTYAIEPALCVILPLIVSLMPPIDSTRPNLSFFNLKGQPISKPNVLSNLVKKIEEKVTSNKDLLKKNPTLLDRIKTTLGKIKNYFQKTLAPKK